MTERSESQEEGRTSLREIEKAAGRPRAAYGTDAQIVCDNLVRIYQTGDVEVQALQGLDLLVGRGEIVAVVGASGSGKSTLLNILSGLDKPTAGAVRVAGRDLMALKARDRLDYRRRAVGFIWQQTARNLLPYLTARENVMLPMSFAGTRRRQRAARAGELLDLLGVADVADRRPAQLSGGQQQRAAIATALANAPEVLFADEPTGELDSATSADVFAAMREANRELGVTVVVVTHDAAVSERVGRTIEIRDGRISTETVRPGADVADGETVVAAQSYAVLDRAGRVQLPREYIDALSLRERVLLGLESDHIGVWPGQGREAEGAQ
ncbi:MAG TPA: ABC transporter ATP-binding protein [Actinocrinis sp.]|uniref:ABC transporter ATP-binding protein n=1 Tax=Actinocrinis sp. TaxID=1920516 RepID=UPI002DDD8334|nr:ABC transporter ATP-binding protein [Actinocrinis sp.]HEV3171285.1 ABC transporter ATP-binding protein [Actinocrinis sp.]